MAIIYCGESNKIPYYIKEADLNIYSIQELAYFIFNNPMLISNNFINKSLIIYIKKYLKNNQLSTELNEMYNSKKTSIVDELLLILNYSNMYTEDELGHFLNFIKYLTKLDESKYINICADSLFKLKKYNKAIKQYEKILNVIPTAYRNIGYAYAKLLVFDKAINYLQLAYEKEKNIDILKDLYFCKKLGKSDFDFDIYKNDVDDNTIVDWECERISLQLIAKDSQKIIDIEDIFLMGENYIKDNVKLLIDKIKEKYRYIG